MKEMQHNYKLTIAIPTFNRAEILDVALQNVLDQIGDSDSIQLLISDNGSTDNTFDVVKKYSLYSNLKYVSFHYNRGFDNNFVNAINQSDGEYIWIKGDDDLIVKGMIDTAFGLLSNEFDFIILNGGYYTNEALVPRVKYEPNISTTDSLIGTIGWHITWIGTVIAKKKLLKPNELISFDFNNFVHIPLYINMLNKSDNIYYSKDVYIHTTTNNSDYFNTPEKLVSIFGENLFDTLEKYVDMSISYKSMRNMLFCFRQHLGMFDFKYFIMSRIHAGYTIKRHMVLLRKFERLNRLAPLWLVTFIVPNSILKISYNVYKKVIQQLS